MQYDGKRIMKIMSGLILKEQAIPILNFILREISNDKIKIPKCTLMNLEKLKLDFSDDRGEMEYMIKFSSSNGEFESKGVLVGQEVVAGMHKSLENLLYVGYWVKRKHTRHANSFLIDQIESEEDGLPKYSIIYTCIESSGLFRYSISDESNLEKSLKNIVKLWYSEEIYKFNFNPDV